MKFLIFLVAFSGFGCSNSGYLYERDIGGLGSDCLYDEDCITRNSFCKGNRICTCKIGYQYDAGSDVCFPTEINLKCSEDYDCSALRNAYCVRGVCQCKMDHVASKDKNMCLPSMKLTSDCEEDSQCNAVVNGSLCNLYSRRCECERGYYLRDFPRHVCLKRNSLHDPCITTADCEWSDDITGKTECKYSGHLTSTCQCREGFVEYNNMCYYSDGGSRAALSTYIILTALLIRSII